MMTVGSYLLLAVAVLFWLRNWTVPFEASKKRSNGESGGVSDFFPIPQVALGFAARFDWLAGGVHIPAVV